jgi:hypothetical protein
MITTSTYRSTYVFGAQGGFDRELDEVRSVSPAGTSTTAAPDRCR